MCSKNLWFLALLGLLAAMLSSLLLGEKLSIIFIHLLGYIPSNVLTHIGAFSLWFSTVKVFPTLKQLGLVHFEDCFDHDVSETIKVVVAAQKGGTVFSAFLTQTMAAHCGISTGVGTALEDNWKDPPPDILPDHQVDFLLACGLHPNEWTKYLDRAFNAQKQLQCVVLTRNPFKRFVSLYKYTRDASETGLRVYSKEMQKIDDVEERVKYTWGAFGEMFMNRTHSLLTTSMKMNCKQIKADDLFFVSSEKFDELAEIILKTLGVKETVLPDILKKLEKSDMNRMTKEEKATNRHISGKTLETGEQELVNRFIIKDPEISKILSEQCLELDFDC